MNETRPNPEALLERTRREERAKRRGKLKIFFGAAPGVGKTYAMLRAAQRIYEQGLDIVVGYVEVHKRPETGKLLLGLEILPRRKIEYRGTTIEEFDLEAGLARRPQILVVDELAHTNAPGSRYAKRHEDIEALLEAGISVYTTLNVQHLESLNDVVEQITAVQVRETVPDAVFESADEVELIDLPPDALLQRLQEGKVYVPEAARAAVSHFFRKGNLTALRELALRRTAAWVDLQMRVYQREHGIDRVWPAGERILVAVGPSELSPKVLRAAKRLAVGIRAEMIALFVETPASARLSQQERDRVVQTLQLAEKLEASSSTVSGISVAEEIVRYARSRNVSKIVLGKPPRPLWKELLFPSIVHEVIRLAHDLDVFVIRGDEESAIRERPAPKTPAPWNFRPYSYAALIVAIFTGIGWLMFETFDTANIAMVYLVGVLLAAIFLGRGPSVLASVLSVAAFDFFFIPPHLTFAVSDTQYLITFAVMLAVGLVISRFATRVRDQAEEAREKERRTAALFAMARELAGARDMEEILDAASRHLRDTFSCRVAFLTPSEGGELAVSSEDRTAFVLDATDLGAAQWCFDHGTASGLGTATLPASKGYFLPLLASRGRIGVLGLAPEMAGSPFSPVQIHLVETFAGQIGLAIERAMLLEEMQKARVEAAADRVRSALLSSVSHDLRTPLATIQGAASALAQKGGSADAFVRAELADSICQEAERLNRLIENLVFATRIEGGQVAIAQDWVSIEEVIGSALERLRESLKSRKIETAVESDLPLVRGDGLLLEQVVFNLLENALRYSPESTPIEIEASQHEGMVRVRVSNRGPGLDPGEERKVFERFYRGKAAQGESRGMGLGLYICKGVVEAHRGRIWAESVAPRGAAFLFSLPAAPRPEVPEHVRS